MTTRIDIRPQIAALVQALRRGAQVWGGSAGVQMNDLGCFVLSHPTEEGGLFEKSFLDPFEALWAYLAFTGGSVLISVTERA